MKKLLLFLPLILLLACSVQKRKYQKGYYVDWHNSTSKKDTHTSTTPKTPSDEPIRNSSQNQKELNIPENENKMFIAAASKMMVQELKRSLRPSVPPTDTCDVLVFKDGSEIRAKVQEIGVNDIKYKRCDNVDGPLYTTKKADLFMIKYANGTREVVKSESEPRQQQQVQRPRDQPVKNYRQERYRKQNHPLAIASLVFGALGLVIAYFLLISLFSGALVSGAIYLLPFFLAVAAIITGILAFKRIREEPDTFKGKGMATPGMIMGMVLAGIYLIIALIFLLAFGFI